MSEIPLKQVIDASVENLKKAMSVDTIIGDPISLPDGTVIIPVSKVSVGFTSGGVDFDSKVNPKKEMPHFGGGNGAGMSVTPVAFLVCSGGEVRVLNLTSDAPAAKDIVGSVTELLEKSPVIIDKLKAVFKKDKPATEEEEESQEENPQ